MAAPRVVNEQPQPDPFEGVLRDLFDKAGESRSMVRDVGPESVAGQTYNDLDENPQSHMQRVLWKLAWFVASLVLLGDGGGLHSAFIGEVDAPQVIPTIWKGYTACRRASLERRVLRAVLAS